MCHWIGDTFWAMQVIGELKKQSPSAELWAGIKPWSKDLLYDLIDDDKILILNNIISDRHREEFSIFEYISEIRTVRNLTFDTVIDLTGNRYSALFLWLTRIKNRVGLDLHKFSFLYTLKGADFSKDRHLYEKPWETLRVLFFDINIPKKLFPPKSSISKKELEKQLGCSLENKIALLAPGAGWKDKMWSLNNFAQCGQFLIENEYKIIISGSEKERALCNELNIKLNSKAYIFIRSLRDFIALLPYISIALTNDSGPAHLCAAAKVKLITVFLVDNDKTYRPTGENVKVITKEHAIAENVIMLIKEIEGKI